jgi:peptide/nickel transport system substrate-binding protein
MTVAAALVAACTPGVSPTSPTSVAAPTVAPVEPTALATATAGVSRPNATSGPTPAAAVTGSPKSGGTFRLGNAADISSLDGHLRTRDGIDTIWLVWDRLIQLDSNLQPQPMLAESWDVSPDFKRIKLNLRKGVTWHSGREFTSDDVRWNFEHIRDPKVGAGQLTSIGNAFGSLDTPDKYTVVLTASNPQPAAFDNFEYINMCDRETLEGPDAKTTAVGTGPFVFGEWAPGNHIALTKNANYWQSGKPYLDGITINVGLDPQTMVTQFEAGSLDAIKTPPIPDFVRLKGDAKYQCLTNPYTGSYYFLGTNVAFPPLDNKLVRQALNYAIDRQRFTNTVLSGINGEPFSLPWKPASLAYDAQKRDRYTFDLDRAASLLGQAGAGNFALDGLTQSSTPELVELLQAYQADLAKIGVTLNVMPLSAATWQDYSTAKHYTHTYVFAASNSQAQLHSPVPMYTSGTLFSTDVSINQENYQSDQYTQLVNAATIEVDPTRQKQLFSQLNDLVLDESFLMPLAPFPPRIALLSSVHGLGYTLHEAFAFTDMWLD